MLQLGFEIGAAVGGSIASLCLLVALMMVRKENKRLRAVLLEICGLTEFPRGIENTSLINLVERTAREALK